MYTKIHRQQFTEKHELKKIRVPKTVFHAKCMSAVKKKKIIYTNLEHHVVDIFSPLTLVHPIHPSVQKMGSSFKFKFIVGPSFKC